MYNSSTSRMTISSHVISERRLAGLSSLVSLHVHLLKKWLNSRGDMCRRVTSYLNKTAEDLIASKIVKSIELELTAIDLTFNFH